MNRTVDGLRDALTSLESQAPDVESLLRSVGVDVHDDAAASAAAQVIALSDHDAPTRRRRTGRRQWIAVAATVALLLLAGTLAAITSRRGAAPSPAAPDVAAGPAFEQHMDLTGVVGYTLGDLTIHPYYQSAPVRNAGKTVAAMYLFENGTMPKVSTEFDPRTGTPVMVAGHNAYLISGPGLDETPASAAAEAAQKKAMQECALRTGHTKGGTTTAGPCTFNGMPYWPLTLAWQYAPNDWVFLQGPDHSPATRALLLKLAAGVHTGVTLPIHTPFSVGYLPTGLRQRAILKCQPTVPAYCQAEFGSGRPDPTESFGEPNQYVMFELVHGGPTTGVENSDPAQGPVGNFKAQQVSVAGHTAYWLATAGELDVVLAGGYTLRIEVPPSVKLTLGEFEKIASSMRYAADVTDPSTWFVASQSLPR